MRLDGFSPEQREVIQASEGPLSILAGPGSGKTTTLAGRIAYLVDERGVPPTSILAITFTTAAAAMLRQRLVGVLGERAGQVDILTFHALGLRLIRQWSAELGFGQYPPAVYARDDARAVLRDAASSFGLELIPDGRVRDADPWSLSVPKLANAVEQFRLGCADGGAPWDGRDGLEEELLRPLTAAYETLLRERRAVDYPSMLLLPVRLLQAEPRALRLLQDAYRFVMVDEFQDTCHTQNALLRLAVERHRNLMVVGDPQQCLPPGSPVQTPDGAVAIETLRAGNRVIAAAGQGRTVAARVQHVISRPFAGRLVRLRLKSGRIARMTPDHRCFVRDREQQLHAPPRVTATMGPGSTSRAWLTDGAPFALAPAGDLRVTTLVPILEGTTILEDEIVWIEAEPYQGWVYDLAIEPAHNFVAGGVVVHNCVFSWRAADPGMLLDFPQVYPDARVIVLGQNHRSTATIVTLSNAVAAPLNYRPDSWTDNPGGPRARLYCASDELDEARFVADEIACLLRTGELEHAGQAAVLFRTNPQARAVALALRAHGIPFRVRADADLFGRAEVRDVIAYVRLAHNPTDGPALMRIINTPPRRLRAVEQALRRRPVPAQDLPVWAQKRGGPPARRAVEELLAQLEDLHTATQGCRPLQALETVLGRTGYAVWLAAQENGPARLRNVEALHALAEGSEAPDLATWLTDLHLGEAESPPWTRTKAVSLTTIHSAKGQEWPVVFVIGLEEGLLPHGQPATAEDEERRLTYVAFSRPQVLLYLTYCRTRRPVIDGQPGRPEPRRPSRFLHPLPPQLIERIA